MTRCKHKKNYVDGFENKSADPTICLPMYLQIDIEPKDKIR